MVEPVEGIEAVRALVWGYDGALGAAGPEDWLLALEAEFGVERAGLTRCLTGAGAADLLCGRVDSLDVLADWARETGFEGDPEDILEVWFATLSGPGPELARVMAQLDAAGLVQVAAVNADARRARVVAEVLAGQVDAVFASGEMGVMLPDSAFFERIEAALGMKAPEILLIAPQPRWIDAADARGWASCPVGPSGVRGVAGALMPLMLRAASE